MTQKQRQERQDLPYFAKFDPFRLGVSPERFLFCNAPYRQVDPENFWQLSNLSKGDEKIKNELIKIK